MPAWQEVLGPVKRADFFQQLMARIDAERAAGKAIYPPASEVFNALTLTPLDNVKVVILGQDPYHGPGQAHGLCFSVQSGVKTPPSLVNIYKELAQDIEGFHIPEHGNLTAWAEQGVLLLNTVLTVEQGKAHSHAKWGWETFTDAVIKSVNDTQHGVVFLLWGSHAQKKGQNIDTQKHYVLNAPHPSPLSAHRGFLGCRHFSQTNTLLSQQGKTPVNWQV
ncbi:uracil-DNA glycosylase [Marisediminitalea sp.]|uniref:uracil-DNA glycosylase n=1 Tax=Marisediminitalea sp. TaxID=2662268 RepID=UPI000C93EF7C|nr:uracil-DNA glycosylase [Alteromonadaceae bacterium]MEC7470384.1 uracil-DNA glycosylase [Pseudomonadota bacterium]HBY38592.1 uracil-DNA glycosylase [Alteromonas sp.]|tara:strand:- start:20168 stop:20827 length:660 start_codon:yes stop_codon:yes gene_type:complete